MDAPPAASRRSRARLPVWCSSATGVSGLGDGLGAWRPFHSWPPASPTTLDWSSRVTVAARLPWLLVALPAGALVDRSDRRRLVVTVEAGACRRARRLRGRRRRPTRARSAPAGHRVPDRRRPDLRRQRQPRRAARARRPPQRLARRQRRALRHGDRDREPHRSGARRRCSSPPPCVAAVRRSTASASPWPPLLMAVALPVAAAGAARDATATRLRTRHRRGLRLLRAHARCCG